MDASVFEFILSGLANGDDFDVKVEGESGEGVVGVDVDMVVIDGDDPEWEWLSVVGFGGHAGADAELGAWGEDGFWDGLGLAVAQSVALFGGDVDVEVVTDACAVEGFFEAAEDLVVAVEVAHGIFARREVEDFAGVVAQDEHDGGDGVGGDGIGLQRFAGFCGWHDKHQGLRRASVVDAPEAQGAVEDGGEDARVGADFIEIQGVVESVGGDFDGFEEAIGEIDEASGSEVFVDAEDLEGERQEDGDEVDEEFEGDDRQIASRHEERAQDEPAWNKDEREGEPAVGVTVTRDEFCRDDEVLQHPDGDEGRRHGDVRGHHRWDVKDRFGDGIGQKDTRHDHGGFEENGEQGDAFVACELVSGHKSQGLELAPRAVAGVDKGMVLGMGIVFGVIASVMAAAAFFAGQRGLCDDARGVDHVA